MTRYDITRSTTQYMTRAHVLHPRQASQCRCEKKKKLTIVHTMWALLVVSWFITPSNYGYNYHHYHKP